MNKASHIFLGKLLCERLKDNYGIFLNTGSFLLGNILPDFSPKFLVKPHYLKNYRLYLINKIQNILDDKQTSAVFGKRYSRDLGIICHYYADFFCFPHSPIYTGDLVGHVKYENDLFQYLTGASFQIKEAGSIDCPSGEISADTIFERFTACQNDYIKNQPSFDIDATQSVRACTEALVLIVSTTLIEPFDDCRLCYPV